MKRLTIDLTKDMPEGKDIIITCPWRNKGDACFTNKCLCEEFYVIRNYMVKKIQARWFDFVILYG